jgi:hypothetical protein
MNICCVFCADIEDPIMAYWVVGMANPKTGKSIKKVGLPFHYKLSKNGLRQNLLNEINEALKEYFDAEDTGRPPETAAKGIPE